MAKSKYQNMSKEFRAYRDLAILPSRTYTKIIRKTATSLGSHQAIITILCKIKIAVFMLVEVTVYSHI